MDHSQEQTPLLQSLTFAHDSVVDLKTWINEALDESQALIEASLDMLDENGDKPKRCLPSLQSDLLQLQEQLEELQQLAFVATSNLEDHLRDLRQPLA